jgi:hypothetical protein
MRSRDDECRLCAALALAVPLGLAFWLLLLLLLAG